MHPSPVFASVPLYTQLPMYYTRLTKPVQGGTAEITVPACWDGGPGHLMRGVDSLLRRELYMPSQIMLRSARAMRSDPSEALYSTPLTASPLPSRHSSPRSAPYQTRFHGACNHMVTRPILSREQHPDRVICSHRFLMHPVNTLPLPSCHSLPKSAVQCHKRYINRQAIQ